MLKQNKLVIAVLCGALLLNGSAFALKAVPSALEKHMAYFSDKYAQLNRVSMQEKLMKIGLNQEFSFVIADMISYVGGMVVKGCPYAEFTAKEGVGKLNHVRDTGIYNLDGSINESRWQVLRSYAVVDGNIEIITERRFYEFLQWCRDHDARPDEEGSGAKASNDEWNLFFNMAADHWKKTENDYERAVTLKTLRQFYDNSAVIFDEMGRHRLPVPKPQI